MTGRLARGSLPWPAPPAPGRAPRPVCRGSITVEAPIAPGARLRITAWPRSGPDGMQWTANPLRITRLPNRRRTFPNSRQPAAQLRRTEDD